MRAWPGSLLIKQGTLASFLGGCARVSECLSHAKLGIASIYHHLKLAPPASQH